ncbi:hypothetical protein [Amycolatopsis magusensis]|uniref:hypothetical protein n=1 Tax=Amycolatopsis magusensis TaxID=882444 RepID=UPI003C30CF46
MERPSSPAEHVATIGSSNGVAEGYRRSRRRRLAVHDHDEVVVAATLVDLEACGVDDLADSLRGAKAVRPGPRPRSGALLRRPDLELSAAAKPFGPVWRQRPAGQGRGFQERPGNGEGQQPGPSIWIQAGHATRACKSHVRAVTSTYPARPTAAPPVASSPSPTCRRGSAFDLLQLGGGSLLGAPFEQRRAQLDDLPLAPGG